MSLGIISYIKEFNSEKCSYCLSNDANSQYYGMHLYNTSTQSYQELIDRGWRRSGTYCYKKGNSSCCAFYTIRCDALNFKLTKSKRKILKKVDCYIKNENVNTNLVNSNSFENKASSSTSANENKTINIKVNKEVKVNQKENFLEIEKLKLSNKSKSKRILRRLEKIKKKLNCNENTALEYLIENRKHKPLEKLTLENYFDENSSLKIKIVPANLEVGQFEYELYKKYQTKIHKSELIDISFKNFKAFLISHPFQENEDDDWNCNENLPKKFGFYHMQYYLNEKLIAVNVIDILPYCVSSVYFFYDPDFSFLNLGTYSSLREIELVRKLNKFNSGIKYYYMGYYIDSCVKMKYKGNINSSYLLCPETYIFHDFKWCKSNFNLTKLTRLTLDQNEKDKLGNFDFNRVLVLFENQSMSFLIFKTQFSHKFLNNYFEKKQDEIKEYAKLVGSNFTNKNLFFID